MEDGSYCPPHLPPCQVCPHEHVEEQSRTRSRVDSRIKALIVMYLYFQDKVTRVEKECESMVAAACHRPWH
jgi:hypothetical protein